MSCTYDIHGVPCGRTPAWGDPPRCDEHRELEAKQLRDDELERFREEPTRPIVRVKK